jgi:hypothetical protein
LLLTVTSPALTILPHRSIPPAFIRGAVSASHISRLPQRFGSDHHPLVTVLRF